MAGRSLKGIGMKLRGRNIATLYRAVNAEELAALQSLRWKGFPPCAEAAFYPALNARFALDFIHSQEGGKKPALYLTRFQIHAGYVRSFEVQTLSGEVHDELWVPAEEWENFNRNIVGRIAVVR